MLDREGWEVQVDFASLLEISSYDLSETPSNGVIHGIAKPEIGP